jgi:cytochrome c
MKKMFIVLGIASLVYACGGDDKKANQPAGGAEKPADTPAVSATNPHEKGLELIGSNDCTTCHAINEKKIGPAYIDVSKKYEATDAIIDTLVHKVINGGVGVWGNVQMTPHPNLSKEDATEMVKYILSLKNQAQ